MNLNEFFQELKNNPVKWTIEHGRIRYLDCCPITWVTFCKTGKKVHVFDFTYAGNCIELDQDVIYIIARGADNPNSTFRNKVLEACGL